MKNVFVIEFHTEDGGRYIICANCSEKIYFLKLSKGWTKKCYKCGYINKVAKRKKDMPNEHDEKCSNDSK